MRHYLSMLLLCLWIGGCGFQLRGAGGFEAALSAIYVSVNNKYGDLHQHLVRSLTRSGITVVSRAGDAAYRLSINAERVIRRAVATTSTISVAEYELRLEVDMVLQNTAGESVIPLITLATERIYTFDRSSLVGSNEEETILLEEMRADLVLQIIRRLDATVRTFEANQ
ncbi:MAG: hypothetical protein IIB71_16795 [Proteobacteria bacterium]|nr:hypothetical protein [Pseudomonadota bacterium]